MTNEETKLITKGNEYASSFLGAFVLFCHLLDSLVDKDEQVDDQRIVRETMVFLEALIVNPWGRDNALVLWPLIVCGSNAWLDSNRLKSSKSDAVSLIESDVLKGMYHEVVWFTAFLCGGQQHMQDMTSRFREYDFEQQGTKI